MGANKRHVPLTRTTFCCPQRCEEKYSILYSRLAIKAPPVKLIRIITWNMKAPFLLGRKAFHSETLLDPYDEFIKCRNQVIRGRKPWRRCFLLSGFPPDTLLPSAVGRMESFRAGAWSCLNLRPRLICRGSIWHTSYFKTSNYARVSSSYCLNACGCPSILPHCSTSCLLLPPTLRLVSKTPPVLHNSSLKPQS